MVFACLGLLLLAAPPSYEECVFGATSIREEGESDAIAGVLSYAPRYPTYVSSQ